MKCAELERLLESMAAVAHADRALDAAIGEARGPDELAGACVEMVLVARLHRSHADNLDAFASACLNELRGDQEATS